MDFSRVISADEKYPKPAVTLEYGTAGFRTKATLLNHVAFRVGIVACLRSMLRKKIVGLMITASHNPAEDNGVKIIDPEGGMLEYNWEKIATDLVNTESNTLENKIKSVIASNGIDVAFQGTVLLGWDTRVSSEPLVAIACEGISSVNGKPMKISLCATPVLHYLVRCKNDPTYGVATIDGYYEKLLNAFDQLWKGSNKNGNYVPLVYFDGANGVGALTMKRANESIIKKIEVNIFNDTVHIPRSLNHRCGADYVKQLQTFPDQVPIEANVRCVSYDGDADRIVYYYMDDTNNFHLMDGDRMATLIAMYLKELVSTAGLDLSFGIVQTAYANGSSTNYIKEQLKIDVSCVKTGVKFLHHKALQYDIGVYFEANGHGTVVFSQKLKKDLAAIIVKASGKQLDALNTLGLLIDMVNETIGDAFSDFLLIETILHSKGWNLQDWESLYRILPYRMLQVKIEDRNVISTTDAERTCVTPTGFQPAINNLISKYKSARAFVRPSGTEDLVRVYAEAATQAEANELSLLVAQLVYDLACGVGDRPK